MSKYTLERDRIRDIWVIRRDGIILNWYTVFAAAELAFKEIKKDMGHIQVIDEVIIDEK